MALGRSFPPGMYQEPCETIRRRGDTKHPQRSDMNRPTGASLRRNRWLGQDSTLMIHGLEHVVEFRALLAQPVLTFANSYQDRSARLQPLPPRPSFDLRGTHLHEFDKRRFEVGFFS